MTAAEVLTRTRNQMDWRTWTQGFWSPLGALRQAVQNLDQHLTVASTHPCTAVRDVRLEMAEAQLAGLRSEADALELAIAQAREALKREDGR